MLKANLCFTISQTEQLLSINVANIYLFTISIVSFNQEAAGFMTYDNRGRKIDGGFYVNALYVHFILIMQKIYSDAKASECRKFI